MVNPLSSKLVDLSSRRPKAVFLVCALVTVLMIPPIFSIQLNPSLAMFVPRNEDFETSEEIRERFGPDNPRSVIYFDPIGGEKNVLTPARIREMHNITKRILALPEVESAVAFSEIVNLVYKYWGGNYSESRDISQATDADIENILTVIFFVLNNEDLDLSGELDLGFVSINLTSIDQVFVDINYTKAVIKTVMSKDFTFSKPEAHSTVALILLDPSLEEKDMIAASMKISDMVDRHSFRHLEAETTGLGEIYGDIRNNSMSEFAVLAAIAAVGVFIIVAIAFSNLMCALRSMITIAMAIIWTLGASSCMGLEFTAISVVVIPVLFGLGIDYTIHMQRNVLYGGKGKKDMKLVAGALFAAMVTTAIAFLSNVTVGILPLIHLGLMLAMGILFAYLLSVTLVPASIANQEQRPRKKSHIKGTQVIILRATHFVRFRPGLTALLLIILLAPSIYVAPQVESEFSVDDFLPSTWKTLRTRERILQEYDGAEYTTVNILVKGDMYSPDLGPMIQNITETLSDNPGVVVSYGQVLKEDISTYSEIMLQTDQNLARTDMNNDFYPDSRAGVEEMFRKMETSTLILDPFSNTTMASRFQSCMNPSETGATLIRVYFEVRGTDDAREIRQALKQDMNEIRDLHPEYKIRTYSYAFMLIDTAESVRNAELSSLVFALVLTALILLVIYRSPVLMLSSLSAVIMSAVFILATMFLLKMPLDVLTVSILALTIGLGVDYSIYIIEEYVSLAERYPKMSVERTLAFVYYRTGTPIYLSALTTMVGFGILTLSTVPIIRNYGMMTMITILYSFLISMVVVPLLLGLWSIRRFGKKWAK